MLKKHSAVGAAINLKYMKKELIIGLPSKGRLKIKQYLFGGE